ncbi:Gfo/Idh/MocA family protein [Arenimonas sp.]|uniref:Gfo/Idh/MocA family protein n=1 Tax=Arenimonas sp. TaxID=1872635 RepID=UPI0035B296E8
MNPTNSHRRRLLGGLAAAATLPLLAGSATDAAARSTRTASKDARLGIAIVGLGGYGSLALERLSQSKVARPAGIVSGSREKALEAAARYGIPADAVYGYDDYERLARDERIDALHLCLPVGLHVEHGLRAFAAGKHVLCEKPLAATAGEAERMAAEASRAGRLLMPAYRAWFSDAVQDAIGRIRQGTHGRLVSVDAHKGFPMALPAGNWRFDPALSGGGCLLDIGLYSLQLQRWCAGGLPLSVRAISHRGNDPRFAHVESDIAWVAEFAGGVLATGSASWRYRNQNRLRIGLETAWLDIDPATPAMGERLRIGLDAPPRIEEPQFPLRDQIPCMYDAFAEACLGRRELPVPASEGIADLRMAEMVYRAANAAPGGAHQ